MDGDNGSSSLSEQRFDVLVDMWEMANPQPRYKTILDQAPVHVGEGFAFIAGRAQLEEAMKNPGLFSSEGGFLDLGNVRPLIPLSVDPPRHVSFRKILDPLFAPRRMDALEDDIAARFN